jgi:hypothetical protein
MSCGIEKELGSPYKPLYVDGLNLKEKKKNSWRHKFSSRQAL